MKKKILLASSAIAITAGSFFATAGSAEKQVPKTVTEQCTDDCCEDEPCEPGECEANSETCCLK